MIKYFIERPISVVVTFGALFILGFLAFLHIPTSILPNVSIPQISLEISYPEFNADEINKQIINPCRQQLIQTAHITNIQAIASDGKANIKLQFAYNTNMDLAFVEVNEKLDKAMNSLPKDMQRPIVTQTNPSDFPIFDLYIVPKKEEKEYWQHFCDLISLNLKRQLEQLSEVVMVDESGLTYPEAVIRIDNSKIKALGLTENNLKEIFIKNQINIGNIDIREGNLSYHITIQNKFQTITDIENILFEHGSRIFRMKDIASISLQTKDPEGSVYYNGKRAIALSLIKHEQAQINKMQQKIYQILNEFQKMHPSIDIHIVQDQSKYLDITISSLKQDLLVGGILIFFVTILFLRSYRLPIIMGISIIISLGISMGIFYIFNLSLNIASLIGLILSIGMMIDNAIVVTDETTQYQQNGYSLDESCIYGTTSVLFPMLSSILTTVAVFLPLILMSGLVGAVFYDQALSITISLFVSYFTAIILLPVLYKLIMPTKKSKELKSSAMKKMLDLYEAGIKKTFEWKFIILICTVLSIPLCIYLFLHIKKEEMPTISRNEFVLDIKWNTPIKDLEQKKRLEEIINENNLPIKEYYILAGQQQFLIGKKSEMASNHTRIYIKVLQQNQQNNIAKKMISILKEKYPEINITREYPETVFEQLFNTDEPEVTIKLSPNKNKWDFSSDSLDKFIHNFQEQIKVPINFPTYKKIIAIHPDMERILFYGINTEDIGKKIKEELKKNYFFSINQQESQIPFRFDQNKTNWTEILNKTWIKGEGESYYPLKYLIKTTEEEQMETFYSDINGNYLPLSIINNQEDNLIENIKDFMSNKHEWNYHLSGKIINTQKLQKEMIYILVISICMMYLIITAQFESFLQPLILLIEIPIDIAAALLILQITGNSFNLMSAIGIIVTCGVIVNDSILKLSIINEYRKQGMDTLEAIHEGGKRRLRSILMTSLTSILALLPILWSFDIGSELQKPFAIAMISAMIVGTFVSLFIIPLIYWIIYKK